MCCKCWKNGERRRGKIPDLLATVWLCTERSPAEDFANREAIAKLLRFASTHTDSSAQTVSLEDYVSRMKEGQENLLYHCRQLRGSESSPHGTAA
ncbi:hypothetical protein DMI65_19395 [Escherichia coli]|nr:hypothetical protein [Escherichia coli]